jgi:hypothetical protein
VSHAASCGRCDEAVLGGAIKIGMRERVSTMACCKKTIVGLMFIVTVGWVSAVGIGWRFGFPTVAAQQTDRAKETAVSESEVLRHVVMFKFKESSTAEDVAKVVDAFRALPEKIPEIASFEYGTDNSPENLANGFTHCFLVTFASEADRDVYLPHQAHKAFVEVLKPHLDQVMVIDYWAKR